MSNCNVSFVTLPSPTVRALAEACVERVMEHRRKEKARALLNHRAYLSVSWSYRIGLWLGFNPPVKERSDEWVEIDLNSRHFGPLSCLTNPLTSAACERECELAVARRLLDACKYADTIQVSTDDLSMITP